MSEQERSIRLAVIDTDSAFLTVLNKRLEGAGWKHRVLPGSVPVDDLVSMKVNALLVDISALGSDGWEFLEKVCGAMPGLGVLVCSDQSTVRQRVRGLRLGADDWIAKPCHPEEVIARLEAVVRRRRRGRAEADVGPLTFGELEIRPDQFQAFASRRSLELTRREFELLYLLAGAQGSVLEREAIYQRVWGYAMAHGDRSVDVFIRKLRQKLERGSPSWSYIHTHFGVGYRFQPERPGGPDEAAAFEASLGEEPRAPAPLNRSEEQPLDPELGDAKSHALVAD